MPCGSRGCNRATARGFSRRTGKTVKSNCRGFALRSVHLCTYFVRSLRLLFSPANAEDSSRRGPRQCATQRTRWRGPRSGRNQLNETSFRWRSGYGLSSRLSALLAMVQAPSTTAGATAKGSSARPEHSNGATPPTPRRRRRPSTPGLRSWLMRCRLRGPGWGQQGGGRAERRCRRWDSSVVRGCRRLLREAQVRQP